MKVGNAGAAVSGTESSCGTAGSSDAGVAGGSGATMKELVAKGTTLVAIRLAFNGPVTIGGPRAANGCELGIAACSTLPISSPTPLKLKSVCIGDPTGNGNRDGVTSGGLRAAVMDGTIPNSVVTAGRGGSANIWETGSTAGAAVPDPRPGLLKLNES